MQAAQLAWLLLACGRENLEIAPVNDPIRLAFRPPGSLATPTPLDHGPALGPDEAIPIPGQMSFNEIMQGLNPLQHVPGVGMIYRATTGAEINPALRVAGAGLVGGPLGMALAGVMAAIEMTQPLDRIRAAAEGRPDPLNLERQPIASADVAGAYRRWGEMASPARLAAAMTEGNVWGEPGRALA